MLIVYFIRFRQICKVLSKCPKTKDFAYCSALGTANWVINALVRRAVQEKESSEFKTVGIDLVLHSARGGGVGYIPILLWNVKKKKKDNLNALIKYYQYSINEHSFTNEKYQSPSINFSKAF